MAEEEAAVQAYPELDTLDQLIAKLDALITESDESPVVICPEDPPKRAFYRITGNAVSLSGRKPFPCEAIFLDEEKIVLRCNKTEIVRQTPVEVTVFAEKSGRGEAFAIVIGKTQGLKRVRGGYEVEIGIEEKRKHRITPGQRLRDCLLKDDVAAWNRWCQDIQTGMELMGMDLKGADLSGYDLCCADFSGSDLTDANLSGAILAGADLRHCKLDHATVGGADFFRARLNRNQAWVLPLCGMPEVESVLFDS